MKNNIFFITLVSIWASACTSSSPVIVTESVSDMWELQKYGITRHKAQGKYGYVDADNRVVIPIEYDSLNHINHANGRILAEKNDRHGLISRTNEVIIPFEYDMVSEVSRGWNYYFARQGDMVTVYDSDGNIVYPDTIHYRKVSEINSLFFSNILRIGDPIGKPDFCYSLKYQKKYPHCEERCLSLATGYQEQCKSLPRHQKTYQKTYMSYMVGDQEKCIDTKEAPMQCPAERKIEDYLPEVNVPNG